MAENTEQNLLLVNIKQACKMLNLSATTVYRLVKNDPNFPKLIKLTAKKNVFKYSDLKAWTDRLREGENQCVTGR